MSVTIFEALWNADFNLQQIGVVGLKLAKEQLHNAVELLGKGYDLNDKVEPLLEKYDGIENVPQKEKKMEGYILEISHVVTRKFHIYMPEDRPYEITVIQDKFDKEKCKITVLRKMPEELVTLTDPEYSDIIAMVKKELEK